jgi:uncharacterized protein YndB with AHSA1/START domain
MIITLLVVAAVILVGLVIFVATRPSEFRVARSVTIPAPAAVVFEHVNDFHNWEAWSPWAKLDPHAKNSFAGPESGEGAKYHWEGNNQVGAGAMTLLESRPHEFIRIRLEFLRPFKATNAVEFTFQPSGEGTRVTWTMTGQNNFMAKAVGLFIDCEKMCGGQFEQGLANLSSVVTEPIHH